MPTTIHVSVSGSVKSAPSTSPSLCITALGCAGVVQLSYLTQPVSVIGEPPSANVSVESTSAVVPVSLAALLAHAVSTGPDVVEKQTSLP